MADSAEFIFDDKEWQRVLKSIDKKWNDIKYRKEFGGIISATVFSDIIKHFEEEKGPDGKWDEWSTAYAKHMQRIGKGRRLILQSGTPPQLKQRITPQGSNWRPVSDGVLFYNNAKTKDGFEYAKHHDEGRSSWKGNPRSFMWLSADGMRRMIAQINEWLTEDK